MTIYLEIADAVSELKYILILIFAGYLFGKWLVQKYVNAKYPDEPDGSYKPDDIPQ